MKRSLAAALVAVMVVTGSAQRQPSPSAGDLVELDVVAVNDQDQPVTDLRREDFTVKEDGRTVELKTFSQVTALGSAQPDDGRVVVLLMDDVGVQMAGTSPMQQIAPVVLSPLGEGDEVSVVRLTHRSDEAFGDVSTAADRIAGYRGGMVPFSRREAGETMLRAIASISHQLEAIDHRRKAIICLGMPYVCDVSEPQGGGSLLWPLWVAAIEAAARANVSVYGIDPTGARGVFTISADGLVRLTGGKLFARENDFAIAARAIWREAGHYYLLGYWPVASKHQVRSIDVRVARKGVHVRARQRR